MTTAQAFKDHSILYALGGRRFRNYAIEACQDKALAIASTLHYKALANIGDCGQTRWKDAAVVDAKFNDDADFNTKPLPFASESFDLVVCEQVIEHLHNTSFFLSELRRIARWGSHLLISTENLASIPNVAMLLCQKAPFSTQTICGHFRGGWKSGEINPECKLPSNHPAHAGVRGHVRVMTTGQMKEVLKAAGFTVRRKYGFGLNHYILFHCQAT